MTERKPTRTVTAQDLLDHAAQLNSYRFSQEFGWQWFVGSDEVPAGTQHRLERRDIKPTGWSRPQGEFSGVRAHVQTAKGTML